MLNGALYILFAAKLRLASVGQGRLCVGNGGHGSWLEAKMVGITFAQQPESPKNTSPGAQIARVRTGTDCGRCVGYSASETSFEPGWIVSIQRSPEDKGNYPDKKTEYKITKQDWEELQHLSMQGCLPRSRAGLAVLGVRTKGWNGLKCSLAKGQRGPSPTALGKHRGNRETAEEDSRHQCEVSIPAEVSSLCALTRRSLISFNYTTPYGRTRRRIVSG
jgi:hypothetical protein